MESIERFEEEHFTQSFINFRDNIFRLRIFYTFSERDYRTTLEEMKKIGLKLEGKKVVEQIPPEELVKIELTKKQIDLLRKIMKKTKEDYTFLLPFMTNQILIFAVALFEYYIKDVVKFIYSKNINILKDKNKSLFYDKLLSFKDLNELHQYIIEKECYSLGYMFYEDLADYFLKKLKIDFSGSGIKKERIIKIFLIRNILIHNRGIVNRKFLEDVKNGKYKLGDEIKIDERNMNNSLDLLVKQAKYIDSCVVKKL